MLQAGWHRLPNQHLVKCEGCSEALHSAQLAIMQNKDRSHPYYWAAFSAHWEVDIAGKR